MGTTVKGNVSLFETRVAGKADQHGIIRRPIAERRRITPSASPPYRARVERLYRLFRRLGLRSHRVQEAIETLNWVSLFSHLSRPSRVRATRQANERGQNASLSYFPKSDRRIFPSQSACRFPV